MIYFDNSSTTKVRKDVINKMSHIMEKEYGNPSSLHNFGFSAEKEIKKARTIISKIIKSNENEIFLDVGGYDGMTSVYFSQWASKYKKIYIFGNGVRGKRLKMYLERRGYSFDGFIVSEQYAESSKDVFLLHELNQADTLIIVTPVDAAIWNELHRRRFDYISLNSELYISMDGYAKIDEG